MVGNRKTTEYRGQGALGTGQARWGGSLGGKDGTGRGGEGAKEMGGMEREASMRVESSTGNVMLERGREKIKTVGKSTRNVRG